MAEHVIKSFKCDDPEILEVFNKCDNASSYHGNFYGETLYKICKANGIALRRLDYNEPQKGKDQCDRDSAVARNALRCYVDEGNDIISAEDIYKALTMSKMKNTKVSVVSFDKSKCSIIAGIIPNISIYHSMEFTDNGIKLWRYYGIGSGVSQSYASESEASFKSGIQVVKKFIQCSGIANVQRKKNSKPRIDRQWCNLVFCSYDECTATFTSFTDLEAHMIQGVHSIPKAISSADLVKKSFANRMLMAASSHSHVTSTPVPSSSKVIVPSNQLVSKGWALPVRSTFRFNVRQKTFLFQLFENGEKNGKKESPEDAHMAMRKSFPTNEYCTVKQIRSLFSRWSKQVRTTSLNKLQNKLSSEFISM